MRLRSSLILALMVMLFCACKSKKAADVPAPSAAGGTYYSVRQYAADHWRTFYNEPFTFMHYIYKDGKVDSSIENIYTVDWGHILKTFFDTDISDPKFLDHYNFSLFNEDMTDTRNFYYEAKDEDLFTRKLQISALQETNKIVALYVETQKKTKVTDHIQKLYYKPLQLIQIQDFEAASAGDIHKETREEYRFIN